MASFIYSIRTTQKDSTTNVMVRIRFSEYYDGKKIAAYASSGIKVPKKAWDDKKSTIKAAYTSTSNSSNEGKSSDNAKEDLEEIKSFVFQNYNMLSGNKISSEWLQSVVDKYWDIRRQTKEDEERAIAEVANRETLNEYIKRYVKEIENGTRYTNRNTKYAPSSIKAIKASLVQFAEFQKAIKRKLNFEDIDLDMYRKYTAWMAGKGYTTNTAGKCVKDLKIILINSLEEGLHSNDAFRSKRFKVTAEEADNIYLTMDEIEAIEAVDISGYAKGYSDARDVFLAGCWLAQRVSDYNNLSPDNVVVEKSKEIVNDKIVEVEAMYIVLTQQKTKAKVKIPATQKLRTILAKYNNQLPRIADQKLNEYIKEIGKLAGITQQVEITTTKGGVVKTERIEKYKLIMSHTARRTGATLMYLSGMDVYDICKITGHASVATLRKYLKADELAIAQKITKYEYFK